MASTKSSGALQASASNAAGSTTTSSTYDGSTAYGAVFTTKVTNGGTGPTITCTVTVNISPDGSTWYFFASQTADLGNSVVSSRVFIIPPEVIKAQVVFSGNTGQAVTVEAQYQQLTTI